MNCKKRNTDKTKMYTANTLKTDNKNVVGL